MRLAAMALNAAVRTAVIQFAVEHGQRTTGLAVLQGNHGIHQRFAAVRDCAGLSSSDLTAR